MPALPQNSIYNMHGSYLNYTLDFQIKPFFVKIRSYGKIRIVHFDLPANQRIDDSYRTPDSTVRHTGLCRITGAKIQINFRMNYFNFVSKPKVPVNAFLIPVPP